ncbi:tRNA (adenosine(37)-N6)-dimethylallyltransferase MiaA [Salinibacillus xinjiangensis]|uniref:tRNA dimethylallyltransferase n=1 Tax=Salinibacillus xinjiangensis TaxID=1229268 RepID=A0A6G1X2V1_9BACI|nr:tRNA (adenosine(37)-N6)-dimethylallyltransferase MiaA [Salinibacillus xinjiangensis]MRG85317.1 tRNA (adenosine(37)-N6)-dimethylallyltransferase MiaA [Salinibacillus xinjiangensis]
MKKTVIAVVGPTAVGKTKLSVELAKKFDGEVISGDSMQIYKGLNIGTAKVTHEEMQGIPHYMIDIKEPFESFSAAEFKENVQHYIDTIHERNHLPIIAGGTGFYIQSTLYNFNFSSEKRDENFEKQMLAKITEKGIEPYFEKLKEVDREQAKVIHPNNIRRVIRALQIYEKTGLTKSELQKQQVDQSPYKPILIGLDMEREELYKRINQRVDQMMQEGLLEEVKALFKTGLKDAQCMQGIGYKEFIPYFEGDVSLEEAIETLKRNSRRYAKRQYTYFRNKLDVRWYSISESTVDETFSLIFHDLEGML